MQASVLNLESHSYEYFEIPPKWGSVCLLTQRGPHSGHIPASLLSAVHLQGPHKGQSPSPLLQPLTEAWVPRERGSTALKTFQKLRGG